MILKIELDINCPESLGAFRKLSAAILSPDTSTVSTEAQPKKKTRKRRTKAEIVVEKSAEPGKTEKGKTATGKSETIDYSEKEILKAISDKIDDHRGAIRKKLTELDASRVPDLTSAEDRVTFYEFLKTLK